MRRLYTVDELLATINAGWFVSWMRVDVDNGPKTLKVDLVCNWRLDDGKVMFIEADLTNWDVEALVTSIRDMAVVQWTDSLNKDRESCLAILK